MYLPPCVYTSRKHSPVHFKFWQCAHWAWEWAGCEGLELVHWGEARPREETERLELHPQFRTRSKGRETHTQKQPHEQGCQNSHYHVEMVHSPQLPWNLPHTCFLSVTEPNWRQGSGGRWERGTQPRQTEVTGEFEIGTSFHVFFSLQTLRKKLGTNNSSNQIKYKGIEIVWNNDPWVSAFREEQFSSSQQTQSSSTATALPASNPISIGYCMSSKINGCKPRFSIL